MTLHALLIVIGFSVGSLCTILAYMLLLTMRGAEVTFPEDRRDA